MNHLYIIGNGFDCHHKINSRYKDFRLWLNNNNIELLNKIEELYADSCNAEWWSDFERSLASKDIIQYAINVAFQNQPDLSSEHCDSTWDLAEQAVDKEMPKVYKSIKECFHQWIIQLNPPSPNMKINIYTTDSLFLTFNYTKTLESLYNLNPKNILHIHGCIDIDENFIIGHGKSRDEIELFYEKRNLSDYNPMSNMAKAELSRYYDEMSDYLIQPHEEAAIYTALSQMSSLKKPVEELIDKYSDFFRIIRGTTHFHVYGFSLSDIDMPYMDAIVKNIGIEDTYWEFSDYNNKNREAIYQFVETYGIRNYNIIALADILQE